MKYVYFKSEGPSGYNFHGHLAVPSDDKAMLQLLAKCFKCTQKSIIIIKELTRLQYVDVLIERHESIKRQSNWSKIRKDPMLWFELKQVALENAKENLIKDEKRVQELELVKGE
jgi:hypothetical protein